MYQIATRSDRIFGLEGYTVAKKYEDPIEIVK
jgi:hypothetical protein